MHRVRLALLLHRYIWNGHKRYRYLLHVTSYIKQLQEWNRKPDEKVNIQFHLLQNIKCYQHVRMCSFTTFLQVDVLSFCPGYGLVWGTSVWNSLKFREVDCVYNKPIKVMYWFLLVVREWKYMKITVSMTGWGHSWVVMFTLVHPGGSRSRGQMCL